MPDNWIMKPELWPVLKDDRSFNDFLGPIAEPQTEEPIQISVQSYDHTFSAIPLIIAFAPDIRLVGRKAKTERKDIGNTVFFRALGNDYSKPKRVCFQFLWVFAFQSGALDFLADIILPALVAFMMFGTYLGGVETFDQFAKSWSQGNYLEILSDGESLGILFFSIMLGLLTLILALVPHYLDWKRIRSDGRFRVRSETLQFVTAILIIVYPWWPLYSSIGLIVFVVILGFVRILEKTNHPLIFWRHHMDYAPIFVWIRAKKKVPQPRLDSPKDWEFERACWDSYHYISAEYPSTEKDLSAESKRQRLSYNNRRIRLRTETGWHDFAPHTLNDDKRHRFLSLVSSLFGLALAAMGFISIYYGFMIPIFVCGIGFQIIEKRRENNELFWFSGDDFTIEELQKLEKKEEYTNLDIYGDWNGKEARRYHLSHPKLLAFWNQTDKEAKLKIRSRLQDPFNETPGFFDTFRDKKEEHLPPVDSG